MKLVGTTTNSCSLTVSEQNFLEDGTDLNTLFACLPEKASCFAHTKQLSLMIACRIQNFLNLALEGSW